MQSRFFFEALALEAHGTVQGPAASQQSCPSDRPIFRQRNLSLAYAACRMEQGSNQVAIAKYMTSLGEPEQATFRASHIAKCRALVLTSELEPLSPNQARE
jgi:hypothetical protein